ncbi:MAG: M16 family metallopeptidase [Vicinamibacterales bacterium]
MRRRHRLAVAAALLCALPLEVAAQGPAAVPPRPAIGPERAFAPPPRVERTLANGLQVVVARFATVPKVSVYLTFRSGLAADPATQAGLAQFVADAAQEGTTTRASRQLRDEVFAMGASLGAAVGQDSTTFTMRGLAETLPQMLDIVSDVVRRPTFPEAEVQLLVANAAQRTQAQLASASFVSNRQFRTALFGSHPYGRIGATPDSVKAIDRAAIVAYHGAHYLPNNAFLVITGDVDAATVVPAVERAFGDWARGEPRRPAFPAPPALTGRRLVFVHRPGSVQSSISVGNLAVKRDDSRWFMLQLANQIYGGAFDSRLVRNIREEKGYTYSPQSLFAAFGDTGVYRAVADVRNDVTGATLKEVYAEMDALRATPPAAAELDGAKAYARGLFVIQNATQNGLAATLNTVQTFGLPADYPETYQARMTALAPETVVTGARMLLGSADSLVVVVGDYTKVKDQLAGFTAVEIVDVTGKPIAAPQ